ncbi:MAG: tetratricopeptide (TPR) repeat protein [Sediminicola sp.]|jgi:tetratricopeptide (TPR) repeat protein
MEQEVGLSKITIQYSRPAVKGRTVFGQLVPYSRIWRVGANASTKITLDSDIKVLGNTLSKGIYALYAFPNENTWEIVFHNTTTHWGDGRTAYDPAEDALRVTVIPEKIPYSQENFLITFDNITHNSLDMIWIWENAKIVVPMTVDTHNAMLGEIAKQLHQNPTAQTYYEAARYYQEQGMEYPLALEYLNKAIALGGDTYYFHRVKSLVEAALGDYKAALVSAQKSMVIAAKEGKDEFVRMNQENSINWKKIN